MFRCDFSDIITVKTLATILLIKICFGIEEEYFRIDLDSCEGAHPLEAL